MLNFFKKTVEKKNVVYCPVKGVIRKLESVDDDTFRSQVLGKTVAIDPQENLISSPVSGTITGIFPTCQSINLRSDSGIDVLIHIGLHTHMLNGTGFYIHIHKGDHVKAGQKLVEIDREMMVRNNYDPVILLMITNSQKFSKILDKQSDEVSILDELLELEMKKQ